MYVLHVFMAFEIEPQNIKLLLSFLKCLFKNYCCCSSSEANYYTLVWGTVNRKMSSPSYTGRKWVQGVSASGTWSFSHGQVAHDYMNDGSRTLDKTSTWFAWITNSILFQGTLHRALSASCLNMGAYTLLGTHLYLHGHTLFIDYRTRWLPQAGVDEMSFLSSLV